MLPVRFIVACENGHIDDFPWIEWVHSQPGQSLDEAKVCDAPVLRLDYRGIAGLPGQVVICENKNCNAKHRSLMGSAGPYSLRGWSCTGNRPWLGPHGTQECNPAKQPRMLQRTATNLYFPKVASSILIPPYSDPLRKIVDDPHNWSFLTSGVQADGSLDEVRLRNFAEIKRIDFDSLRKVVTEKLTGVGTSASRASEEEFRYSEYLALLGTSEEAQGELVTLAQDTDLYQDDVRQYIDNIVLVEKLAETRALTGFSRINPPQHREFDRQDQSQLSLQPRPWLPAIRVYGEGIFLTLRKSAVDKWTTAEVAARYGDIIDNHRHIYQNLGLKPRNLQPKFFLLHTLAHILIRRLSYECGYGSASLRERIYSWGEGNMDMTGILIYTAAGDCEGTMGGLVQQGRPSRFDAVLLGAIQDAQWCSSDPLCIESRGQGIDSLNRAACYACALLPETSCEEGNRFLDRAALIGTPDNSSLGFFNTIAWKIMSGTI